MVELHPIPGQPHEVTASYRSIWLHFVHCHLATHEANTKSLRMLLQHLSPHPIAPHLSQIPPLHIQNTPTTPCCSWHGIRWGGAVHLDSGCVLKQVPPPRVEKQKAVRYPLPVHCWEGVVGMALRNAQTACSSLSFPAAYSHLTITNSAGPECIHSSLLSRQGSIETLGHGSWRDGWR